MGARDIGHMLEASELPALFGARIFARALNRPKAHGRVTRMDKKVNFFFSFGPKYIWVCLISKGSPNLKIKLHIGLYIDFFHKVDTSTVPKLQSEFKNS